MSPLGPEAILDALVRHEVDHVVIGGLAAVAHGSRRMTRDIDVVVEPTSENLARLQTALEELTAVKLLPDGREGLVEPSDLALIGLGTLHTQTAAGRLDIVGAPAGAAPYAALRERAVTTRVAGMSVLVSGLDDLIAMKRAAGRPLDLQDIADLTAIHPDRRPG